jgi:glycosyltransferase involved in cell wall biosynthesis
VDDTNIADFNRRVNQCYIHYVIGDREKTRPTFSAITTTYNSYEKINRPFESLKTQTMRDWEWVIVDDSPDDAHFQFLRDKFKRHPQIRLYRRDRNSGSIGNVKNEAVALARGKYTVELDHDDELAPTTLADATKAFGTDPKVGFVYMDFINIYEPAASGGPAENFKYSDFISFGYGGYYSQYMDGQWRYVYITPNVNNITASALIALPNHPRMWRTSLLQTRLGNYSEYLPVCDDLEILLRTFADPDIQIVKIPKVGYVQYMNRDNNNFSLIRNDEINRLGPQHISPMFYEQHKMHQSFFKRNAYEDESFLVNHSQIWKRPPEPIYVHKYANRHFHPDYTHQLCVIGPLDPHLVQKLQNLPATTDVLWLTNTIAIDQMWQLLEQHNLQTKVKCYYLKDTATKEELQRFFLRLYRTNTLPYEFAECNSMGAECNSMGAECNSMGAECDIMGAECNQPNQPIQDDSHNQHNTTDAVPPKKNNATTATRIRNKARHHQRAHDETRPVSGDRRGDGVYVSQRAFRGKKGRGPVA